MNHIAEIMEGLAAELEAERNPAADRIRAGLRRAWAIRQVEREMACAAGRIGKMLECVHEEVFGAAAVYHGLAESCFRMADFYVKESGS